MTTITINRATVEQALEILEKLVVGSDYEEAVEAEQAMESFRAALAQQAEPVASRGWLFRRNADGTIGIFAPPPKPGEFQRTSDCVGPNNRDLHELLGKLADHMAAPPQQAEPDAYGYASRVAVSIWQWNYKDTAPNWKPLDDLMGVLTQIDNMTSGLTRRAQQAEPVEKARAWYTVDEINDKFAPPQQAEPKPMHPELRKMWEDYFDKCFRAMPVPEQAEPVEPVGWNWMLDGQPYGQAYYGNPPDTDIAERAAIAGRTVRLLYTAPPQRKPLPKHDQHCVDVPGYGLMAVRLVRAVERAHGITGDCK